MNFTLENHGEYARLENIDNSIGRLMDDIAAIRGDNFDDDDEPRYKCPGTVGYFEFFWPLLLMNK